VRLGTVSLHWHFIFVCPQREFEYCFLTLILFYLYCFVYMQCEIGYCFLTLEYSNSRCGQTNIKCQCKETEPNLTLHIEKTICLYVMLDWVLFSYIDGVFSTFQSSRKDIVQRHATLLWPQCGDTISCLKQARYRHFQRNGELNQILRRQTFRFHDGSKVPAVTITVFLTIQELKLKVSIKKNHANIFINCI
jgi:hypothetical protein